MKATSLTITIEEYSYEEVPDKDRQLIESATEAARNAYAPYSAFLVGAALRMDNGEIIAANNQENAAFPSGMCAERVAIYYANARYPENAVVSLAITALRNGKVLDDPVYPCGACRQVLLESEERSKKDIRIIMSGAKKVQIVPSASSLLPLHFKAPFLK